MSLEYEPKKFKKTIKTLKSSEQNENKHVFFMSKIAFKREMK